MSKRNAFGSPFLGEHPEPEQESQDFSPRMARLLYESPFSQLNLGKTYPSRRDQHLDEQENVLGVEDDECCDEGEWQEEHEALDHERESSDELALQFLFEGEDALPMSPNERRSWVLSIEDSALERLPRAARDHFQGQIWKRIEFPGHIPKGESKSAALQARWALAESLFVAMATVTPERRVPSGIRFHAPHVEKVPGQERHRLVPEARDAFVRMREAAAKDGVQLTISSSFRTPEKQAALSKSNPNSKAVAKGKSAHMYGLAVDLSMAARGLDFGGGSYTRSGEKMAKIVRMYRSPVYKWMALYARDFGFFPYRREPWHWEFNPPGFKEIFEARGGVTKSAGSGTSTASVSTADAPSAELVRFAQRVLNAAEGERLSVDGDFGKLSRAALSRFRAKYHLGAGFAIDAATELALLQRAFEALSQASMFAEPGKPDGRTDQLLAAFRAERGLGFGAVMDAATRRALGEALEARGHSQGPTSSVKPTSLSAGGVSDTVAGTLWSFEARTLGTKVAIYCPKAALGQSDVDLLFFVHGLLHGCPRPKIVPEGFATDAPFELGKVVDATGRSLVLVIPLLDWSRPGGASVFGKDRPKWHALAKPEHLNALLAEVLAEIGRKQAAPAPMLRQLAVAGHSRAYDFLEPLAASQDDAQMQVGALSKLDRVWALDSTYSGQVSHWQRWLDARPNLRVHVLYRSGTKTESLGKKFHAARGGRLFVTPCSEGHCALPRKRLPILLKSLGAAAVAQELEEPFAEDWLQDDEDDGFDSDAEEFEHEREVLNEVLREEESEPEDGDDEAFAAFESESDDPIEGDDLMFDASDELVMDDDEEGFEFEEEDAVESELDDEVSDRAPLPVPANQPVPFAPEPPLGSYWPVLTTLKDARLVSYRHAGGSEGRPGRMFRAARRGKRKGKVVARYHAGVDVYARIGDTVVACEDGTIVAFDFFYQAKSGQQTYKILIEHEGSGVVVNYGEVTEDSLRKHGLAKGSRVVAGQAIGRVSDTKMLHFETYVKGTRETERWWGDASKAPAPLLNPTRYLLFLRAHGRSPLESSASTGGVTATAPQTSSGTSTTPSAELVRFAQRVLNAAEGEKLDDDGKVGKLTRAALTRFRSKYQLGAGDALDNTTVLALGQRALEELAQASHFPTPGTLDDATRDALADFRMQRGLGSDARLDSVTRQALTDALTQRQTGSGAGTSGIPSPRGSQPVTVNVLPDPHTVSFLPKPKKKGFFAYGGAQVTPVLRVLRAQGLITLSDVEIDVLQRAANVESSGRINAVQTWDSAFLSFGFIQWTIKWGEVQELVAKVPQAFARYGIVLAGSYRVGDKTIPGLRGASTPNALREQVWVERFYRAGFDPEIVAAQANKAVGEEKSVAATARKLLGPAYDNVAFRTPLMRAFVYEAHNNRPTYLKAALRSLSTRISGTTSAQNVFDLLLEALIAAHPADERHKPRSIAKKIQ